MLADESDAVGGVPHVQCVQMHRPVVQESLANVKVSAKQQCVYCEGPIL